MIGGDTILTSWCRCWKCLHFCTAKGLRIFIRALRTSQRESKDVHFHLPTFSGLTWLYASLAREKPSKNPSTSSFTIDFPRFSLDFPRFSLGPTACMVKVRQRSRRVGIGRECVQRRHHRPVWPGRGATSQVTEEKKSESVVLDGYKSINDYKWL